MTILYLYQPLQAKMKDEARALMEKHRGIKRTNFNYIEFVLRLEANKLRMLQEAQVSDIRHIWTNKIVKIYNQNSL